MTVGDLNDNFWFAPLAEPYSPSLRRTGVNLSIAERAAIAARGGAFFVKSTPFPEPITVDRTPLPLSEPRRFPPRLHASSNPAAFLVSADPFPENISVDKGLQPLAEPYNPETNRPALRSRVSIAERTLVASLGGGFMVKGVPFEETIRQEKWWRPLGEPQRFPKRLAAPYNPSNFLVKGVPFGETILQEKWWRPLGEPQRFPPALKTHSHMYLALVKADPFPGIVRAPYSFALIVG